MMGNPMNTEVCEKEKPSDFDYDSSWTSESTDTECGGTDEPACSTSTASDATSTASDATSPASDAGLAQVEVEKFDAIEVFAQVEGEEIDAIEELAQVEAEAVYDYWDPDNCASGMLC